MATKNEERKSLDKIRGIVDGLGQDSYLATAFAGCFEDAELNIDDDAAYSMKDRWESEQKKNESLRAEVLNLNGIIEAREKKWKKSEQRADAAEEKCARQTEEIWKARGEIKDLQDQAEADHQTIIELKALLYDMMMKEAQKQ